MAGRMQAAVVEQFGKPLAFREWDIPSPGAGQILVKTEACGVCHTDLHAAQGDWPVKPTLPFIPGHEGIGLVAAVGAGVTSVKDGGFAEYILADPNYVARVPAGLSANEAAPIICAGITTYKGIKETAAKPG